FALASLLPYAGALADPAALRRRRTAAAAIEATALELIGIDRAFTADDLRRIDHGIGLEPGIRA
ncbi:MAG: hypothetical protein QOG65_3912, partial [Actinomycetota bacterium]|nr:hypothetical protein [Actinomycetota bacterium]